MAGWQLPKPSFALGSSAITAVPEVFVHPTPAAFTGAVRAAGAFFSVTVQMNRHVQAAIAAIGEDAWKPIKYPRAIWDE